MKILLFTFVMLFTSLSAQAQQVDRLPEIEQQKQQEALQSVYKYGIVVRLLNQFHDNHPEIPDLVDASMKSMFEKLDPHSSYLTASEFEKFMNRAKNSLVGIGIIYGLDDSKQYLKVLKVLENSPAERFGLKIGDIITHVDDKSVTGLSLEAAGEMILGSENTIVELSLIRDQNSLTKKLKRGKVHIPNLYTKIVDDNILHLQLLQFTENLADQVHIAVVKAQVDNQINGVIIDVRNNPGGLLSEAHAIADLFMSSGTTVSVRGRAVPEETYLATNDVAIGMEIPVVVLINKNSASASEILAGSLKESNRATIMGVTSFGKGSVQKIFPLPDRSAIKITTAKYYTHGGTTPHGIGIEPHIKVELPEDYWKDIQPGDQYKIIDPQLERAIMFLQGE